MRVLALDTSSARLTVALVEDGRVLREEHFDPPARAGDLLPRALGPLDGVDAIAVGLGPGSFTGLRIGLAAAKALAYARRWPIAGVSSLRALAASVSAPLVCATSEGRKGELYASLHRGDEVLWPEAVYRAEALAEKLRALGPCAIVGAGAHANAAAFAGLDLRDEPRAPKASSLAWLALPALQGKSYDSALLFALAPNYLQPTMAEVALAEGRVGGLVR